MTDIARGSRKTPRAHFSMGQPPVSFAFVDGRPLFLDVEEDSYFLLAPEAEAPFGRWLASGGDPADPPDAIAATVIAGRLDPRPVIAESPIGSALLEKAMRCSLADVAAACRLVVAARLTIRRRPLGQWLASVERGELPNRRAADDTLTGLAARFAAARRLAPVAGNCLSNSLALLRWLGDQADGACLIFGAKLDPFAAHCWVQAGDLLLNDHPDRIERFTPVRVVRCTRASR